MKKGESPKAYAGFSLIEVALALAIASMALVALISMIPQFLKYERESADQTAIGTIMEDIHDRLEGQPFKVGVPSISPIFYNEKGRYWDPVTAKDNPDDSPLVNRKFYRGDIKLVKPADSIADSKLPLAVKIDFYWPLDEEGNPLGDKMPKTSATYYITPLTGPDWEKIDLNFIPKIEY